MEGMTGTISLDGQVAVITGAGRGLGRSYALELARRGAAVIVNDIAGDAADAVVAEIVAGDGRAAPSYDSVATADGGAAIVQAAVDSFGTVDVVVHNAGAWRNAPFDEMTTENLDPVLDVHLRGAFFVVRPAWPILVAKGYGRIILTSSNVAAFGREQGANYVAAKAALLGLTRALALEGERHGIAANAIMPNAATSDERRPMSEEYRARLEAALAPLEGRRTPEMVAAMVAFLASRECTVTGETFSAGAGRYARVFAGVTEGWTSAPPEPPPAEAILEHLDEIRDRTRYLVPVSVFDEVEAIAASVRSATAAGPSGA
jgi:NAD(P)-dependent dehydrogenase (short-subunit alcohol dehydrogenase family)